jgi:hypothetical protein
MAEAVEALIFDLLERVAKGNRTCEEVLDAWQTLGPKLPVREAAIDLARRSRQTVVRITAAGLALLGQRKLSKR